MIYPAGTFAGEPFDANDFVFRATLLGDTDLDRDVDFNDLLNLAKHYGTTTNRGVADGNVDGPTDDTGTVDFDDLLMLAKSYNQTFTLPAAVVAATTAPTRKREAQALLDCNRGSRFP